MNIKFREGILEYKDGPYYRKNDGRPFEVDKRVGDDLIKTSYFEEVKEKPVEKSVEKSEKKVKENK